MAATPRLEQPKRGGPVKDSDVNKVDIEYNETVLKKIYNGRDLKGDEVFVWLHWCKTDDDACFHSCVFAALTLLPNGGTDFTTDIDKAVARSFVSNRKTSSDLVTRLVQCFHARLVTITLSPITLVLCLRKVEDFKYLGENRQKLAEVFKGFMANLSKTTKLGIRLKLVHNPPFDMLRKCVNGTGNNNRLHHLDTAEEDLLDQLIQQRFQAIESEIARQKEAVTLIIQRRKEQHDKIHGVLLQIQNNFKENAAATLPEASAEKTLPGMPKPEINDLTSDKRREETAGTSDSNRTFKTPPVPEKPPRSAIQSPANTGSEKQSQPTVINDDETRGVTHRFEKFVYPRTVQNDSTKGSKKGFEFGICRLNYTCTYYRSRSPDGSTWFKRRTDYILTNGEHKEEFTRVAEYSDYKSAPDVLADLPHGLVPVSSKPEPQQPTQQGDFLRSLSDYEKLLLRSDSDITKEFCPELETQHAAKVTLEYLRDIVEDNPVWDLVQEALQQDDVPRCTTGLDTILVLDNCGTWESLVQMKETAVKFVNGIEHIAKEYGLDENIAVISLGSRAKIDHPLSTDYKGIKEAIEQIQRGGKSTNPYLEGEMVCLAAATKGGVVCLGAHLRVPQRLILVTDGTRLGRVEQCKPLRAGVSTSFVIKQLSSDFVKRNIFAQLVVVPHSSVSKASINDLATTHGATVVGNISSLCDHQRVQRRSAHILRYVENQCGLNRTTAMKLDSIIRTFTYGFTAQTQLKIKKLVEEKLDHGKMNLKTASCFDNINEEDGLPPLGTRVERGPDWIWRNEDLGCAGTIINHDPNKEEVYVTWDHYVTYKYSYGKNGYDVLSIDNRPAEPVQDGYLFLGMQVERGPDWHPKYGDQDGGPGSFGTVIRTKTGRVMVRWPNGEIHEYRFGENGKYDLTARFIENDHSKEGAAKSTEPPSCSSADVKSTTRSHSELPPESRGRWQWQDSTGQWLSYSQDNSDKLTRDHSKRPIGGCLVQREDGKSYRVNFRTMTEKSLTDKQTRAVRKGYQ